MIHVCSFEPFKLRLTLFDVITLYIPFIDINSNVMINHNGHSWKINGYTEDTWFNIFWIIQCLQVLSHTLLCISMNLSAYVKCVENTKVFSVWVDCTGKRSTNTISQSYGFVYPIVWHHNGTTIATTLRPHPVVFAKAYKRLRLSSIVSCTLVSTHTEPRVPAMVSKARLIRIGIPIISLRRSSDRLRLIMGIPIPVRRRLLSE